MLWFIPTTHKVVIAALLVVALAAFAAFCVTRVVARRRRRQSELDVSTQAAIRHGARLPEPPGTPPAQPRDE